jgi:hypothetical protein
MLADLPTPLPTKIDNPQYRKARGILANVDDLELIEVVGHHFVIRGDWPNALFAFDRMTELATPKAPDWMARGYEHLGYIYQAQDNFQQAYESWKISKNIYRRIARQDREVLLAKKLKDITGIIKKHNELNSV